MSTPDGGNELGWIVMLDRLAGARAYEKRKAGDRISADLADDLKTLLKET